MFATAHQCPRWVGADCPVLCYDILVHTRAIQNAICAHICERMPDDPATYVDIVNVAVSWKRSITSLELDEILTRMLKAGRIETFEDDERGAVYVRDC